MNAMIGFRVVDTGLGDKVRDLRGRFKAGNQAARRANQASVEWLGQVASDTLARQIRRDPDVRTRRRLADVVADPAASAVRIDGFDFLVENKVRRLSARAVRYYRVIEGRPGAQWGSLYWKDRRIRLEWSGPSASPFQAGRFRRNARTVLITRGIPAYHYTLEARKEFERQDKWREFFARELRMPVRHG